MNRQSVLLGLIFLVLLVTACNPAAAEADAYPLQPCHLAGGLAARCGTVTVLENRADVNGRTLELNVAVIPANNSAPEPDPLFLLAGGPGQAATEIFPQMVSAYLARVQRQRDIVLIDQRGTGQSNPLTCTNLEEIDPTLELADEAVVALLEACRETLAGQADLTQYGTDIAMIDLDEVRQALGYGPINLYGVSYGTRAALAYLRLYPEQVRTMVLDAVAGPELILYQQMPADGQRALDLLLARCTADPICVQQFPDLEGELTAVLARLQTSKQISFIHPLSGELIVMTLTADGFMQTLFNLLYSSDVVALLPLLIHHAHETDDFAPLMAQSLAFRATVGLYQGMTYAVTCNEDAPLIDLAKADALQTDTLFPLLAADFQAACGVWPKTAVSPSMRQPVMSDIPVLLLSGDADPVTPPVYARQVAQSLPNSLHLVVPDYGHGVMTVGCMPDVIATFLEQGSVTDLDMACLADIAPPAFFINFAGPLP